MILQSLQSSRFLRKCACVGTFLLAAVSAHATTYYVASTGSDSNTSMQAQNPATPWLTLNHAVTPANGVACGDTIIVIANGVYVSGDMNLPFFPNCFQVTTIQSSALAQFWPIGYRTNPVNDANIYGKLVLTGTGIQAVPEAHGSNISSGGGYACQVTNIASDVFSFFCNDGLTSSLPNGTQVEFEVSNGISTTAEAPTGFNLLQKYYVINSSSNTFKISVTSGGSAVTGVSCTAPCQYAALLITIPLQVTVGSANIVMHDSPGTQWAVNTPVAFSAASFQNYGTLPGPLVQDTVYYIKTLVGSTFTVSATLGGSPIVITSDGTGQLIASNTNLASQWTFRGLEIVDGLNQLIGTMIQFGSGQEASSVVGRVHNMEMDRVFCHSQNLTGTFPAGQSETRCVLDAGSFNSYHDGYFEGFINSESQAIYWNGSTGMTVSNMFLEGAGEVILGGGNYNGSGMANSYATIIGNYAFKPPTIRFQSGTGAASGACLSSNDDPFLQGGEWYTDTNTSQKYRCVNGTWTTTASSWPYSTAVPFVKTGFEHKNGRYITYSGNIGNYNWASGQDGEWFNNAALWEDGPGTSNDHITIINNAFYNVYKFANRQDGCNVTVLMPCIYPPSDHVTTNNLTVVNPLACGVGFTTGDPAHLCGQGNIYQSVAIGGDGTAATNFRAIFQRDIAKNNTIYVPDTGWPVPGSFPNPMNGSAPATCFTYGPILNLAVYQNNIWPGDFQGECVNNPHDVIASLWSNSTFSNNAILKAVGTYAPTIGSNTWTNTVYPSSNSVIKYVNADGTINGDYHLNPTSPYSAANNSATQLSTNGTDLGADIDLVNMVTSGAKAGTPPVNASLVVNPGSTKLVFRYQAQATSGCTATIYSAPARTTANQVATNSDGGTGSISDVLTRQLYISGLSASTHYWYKIAGCFSTPLVGDFLTRPAGTGTYNFTFNWNSATAMQYSSSSNMSSPTTLGAATTQAVPVATNSVIYAQVGTTGPITVLIAP